MQSLVCENPDCNWHGIYGLTFRPEVYYQVGPKEITFACPKCRRRETISRIDFWGWLNTFNRVTFSKYNHRLNGKILYDFVQNKTFYRKGDEYIDTGFSPEQVINNTLLRRRFTDLAD